MGDAFFTFFWFLCNITFQVISEDKYIYNVLNILKKILKKLRYILWGQRGEWGGEWDERLMKFWLLPQLPEMFLEISQNSLENTCARVSFLIKEALAQVFSCEFCEISKSIFFHRTPLVAASGHIFTNQEWQDLYFNRWRAVIFYSKLLVNILHRGCWDLKLGFMEVKLTIFINFTFLALKHIMYVWFHLISYIFATHDLPWPFL